MGFFDKLKKGLAKTRFNVTNSVNQVFSSYDVVDDDFYEELEEIMIMSDMGASSTRISRIPWKSRSFSWIRSRIRCASTRLISPLRIRNH